MLETITKSITQDTLVFSWNQQMLLLQKVTGASLVFLAQGVGQYINIVASTQQDGEEYAVDKQISNQCFGIDEVLQNPDNGGIAQDASYFVAPIVSYNQRVWGVIVLLAQPNGITDEIESSVSTFCKIIGDQVVLQQFKKLDKRLAKNNDEAIELNGLELDNTGSNETEVAALKDRLEFSMSAGNIAYLEYNLHEQTLHTNKIYEEITGYVLENSKVDMPWIKTRLHPEDWEYISNSFAHAIESGDAKMVLEFRLLDVHNKYLWLRFSGQLILDDDGLSNVLGVLMDISDTKELMNALLLERNRSMQASEAKTIFLANMSHEIRTPMNSIIGFSELLSKHIAEAPLNGYLNSIKASGNVLLALINDLLDLEKIEAGQMTIRKENTNFVFLLKEIEQSFSMDFVEKKVELLVHTNNEFPKLLYVDSLKMKQILLNLISNALKFTHRGQVSIFSAFTFNSDQTKGNLFITVSDTGIGISQDKKISIFDPFVQDKRPNEKNQQGTGLGLSIVRKLVSMMGGVITMESQVDKGTTFSISIPDIEATNDPFSEIEGETISSVMFNQERVLIIDNVQANLDVLCAQGNNLNLDCTPCFYGDEIVNQVLKHKPTLIIMDMRMPKANEFKYFKLIKANDKIKNIPIIASSASSDSKEERRAIKEGFHGFLSKPISQENLIGEVTKFITAHPRQDKSFVQIPNNDFCFVNGDKEKLRLILETSVWPVCQDLQEILSSEKLNVFLAQLNQAIAQSGWPPLMQYAQTLNTAIKSYDFETIQKMIHNFKFFITELK